MWIFYPISVPSKWRYTPPDLLVINTNLPEESGLSVLQKIRKDPVMQDLPIIMISDYDNIHDKITAFDEGADDYLTRPFDSIELIIRIKALLRRTHHDENKKFICMGDLKVYPELRKVLIDDNPIELTEKEFDTFFLLISNPETIFSKKQLQEKIWGSEYIETSRTVEVHICTLRKKLGKYGYLIKTLRNVGYYMENLKSTDS